MSGADHPGILLELSDDRVQEIRAAGVFLVKLKM